MLSILEEKECSSRLIRGFTRHPTVILPPKPSSRLLRKVTMPSNVQFRQFARTIQRSVCLQIDSFFRAEACHTMDVWRIPCHDLKARSNILTTVCLMSVQKNDGNDDGDIQNFLAS